MAYGNMVGAPLLPNLEFQLDDMGSGSRMTEEEKEMYRLRMMNAWNKMKERIGGSNSMNPYGSGSQDLINQRSSSPLGAGFNTGNMGGYFG